MMRCQKCGRNNANINYTRIFNGKRTELHVCSECAKEMNLESNFHFDFGDMFSNLFDEFSFAKRLAMPNFAGFSNIANSWDSLWGESFAMPDLLITQSPFMESSTDAIEETLNTIQKKHKLQKKKTNHNIENKKEPKAETINTIEIKKQNEIKQLKEKIQEYIKTEEYEKAAVLRDKIKELEK